MLKYRPEIDSLRAVAILLVVFFHFNLFGTSGGFIGVDVFFVISGYLITSIIINEINNNKFSFINFYIRRFRRIIPALYLTIILSLFLGYLFFSLTMGQIISLIFLMIGIYLIINKYEIKKNS